MQSIDPTIIHDGFLYKNMSVFLSSIGLYTIFPKQERIQIQRHVCTICLDGGRSDLDKDKA